MKTVRIKHDVRISDKMAVGCAVRHPDGRLVYVTSGYYLDPTYGRVSNFWHWQEILSGGALSDVEENGYGWTA